MIKDDDDDDDDVTGGFRALYPIPVFINMPLFPFLEAKAHVPPARPVEIKPIEIKPVEMPVVNDFKPELHDVEAPSEGYKPLITKETIDHILTNHIGLISYYGATSFIKHQVGSSFAYHTVEAMGFKLFVTVATPLIAQAIEANTDMLWNQGKYLYYSTRCWLEMETEIDCDALENPYLTETTLPASWFNSAEFVETVKNNVEKLTLPGMVASGLLSAAATEIRADIYKGLGLTPYTQGYIFKNFINVYFKDWIKAELRQEIAAFKEKIDKIMEQGFQLLETKPTGEPLTILDVLQTNDAIPGLSNEEKPNTSLFPSSPQDAVVYVSTSLLPDPMQEDVF